MAKQVGIYAIVSGNRAYIGSTTNFDRRWEQHREKLTEGNHSSHLLQKEFDRVGLQGLKFKIVERCTAVKLEERERHWIAKYYENGRSLNVVVPGHPRWNQPLRRKSEREEKDKTKTATKKERSKVTGAGWFFWLWLWILLGAIAFLCWGLNPFIGAFIGGAGYALKG